MKRVPVRVTDHALLRHMQRVMDLPVEDLRKALERRISATYLEGASGVTMDGFSYRIGHDDIGPVVTTVLDRAKGLPRPRKAEVGE